jgi:hypothetical protein
VSLKSAGWVTGVALVTLAAGIVSTGSQGGPGGLGLAPVAQAQNLGLRVVAGTVVDANSAPVSGATVFLKDLKTKSIRSYSSSNNGSFRFTQVSMSQDQELWAEKDGKKTVVKTVSSWDTRKEFSSELKIK